MIATSSKSSKPYWLTGLLVAGVVATGSGCQFVFGDFEFRPTAEDPSGISCSVNGAYNCNAGQPQVCKNGIWTDVGVPCDPPELCNARGSCDVCFAGTYRCNAEGTAVEFCRATGDGWDVSTTCAESQYCDAAKLVCVACRLRETICTDATSAKVCRGDQSGFDSRSCNGLPCIVVGDGNDYCADCNPATSPPSCSYVPTTKQSFVQRCGDDYLWKPTLCENTCVMVSAGNPVCQ